MKIGIIGLGMVGTAVQHGLKIVGHEVKGYDIKYPETSIKDVLDSSLCFICVPTPSKDDGHCDTSIVEKVVKGLSDNKYKGLIVIKSTVKPGTTDKLAKQYSDLKFAFCPEFLREKAAYTDFVENHDLCAIGAYDEASFELVKQAHGELPQNFYRLTPLEAELIKYFSNVFNALKIIFANEFYEVCEALGADYSNIKNAIVKRKTVLNVYLDCNQNYRGFGGNCLPKDTAAFAALVKELGINMDLFQLIIDENKKFKTTVL
jgi:UDPglucose 6-dehydrogenase